MQMAEQKLAEKTRLAADLDVRLQAACCTLDCSAGDVTTDLTDQHQHVLWSSVAFGMAVYQILHSLYTRQFSNLGLGVSNDLADNLANAILRFMLVYHCVRHNLSSTLHTQFPLSLPPAPSHPSAVPNTCICFCVSHRQSALPASRHQQAQCKAAAKHNIKQRPCDS